MTESADMIVPLLREMRAENAVLHQATSERLATVDARLDKLEATLSSFRHALTADSLVSKLVAGEFEEPIEPLERKVRALESHT